jgi:hypothetical protein
MFFLFVQLFVKMEPSIPKRMHNSGLAANKPWIRWINSNYFEAINKV